MNARRIANLHRDIARAHTALADALEAESDGTELTVVDEPSRARPKAPRRPRSIVRPSGSSSPEAAAAADRILRERGLR